VTVDLQRLIGVDKKNPYFTICRDASNPGHIYVYFGAALMEVISEDTSNPEFKLLIARLYNAGVKAKSITEKFGIARTTMKRWGDALKSGDADRLVAALSGQGAPRKLTPEILSFIKVRFLKIYQENHYNYSIIIRKEIKEIFGKEISSESLRPLFKELRNNASESDQNEGREMPRKPSG
jgi:transposase